MAKPYRPVPENRLLPASFGHAAAEAGFAVKLFCAILRWAID